MTQQTHTLSSVRQSRAATLGSIIALVVMTSIALLIVFAVFAVLGGNYGRAISLGVPAAAVLLGGSLIMRKARNHARS